MRLVVALGGNALGASVDAALAARAVAPLVAEHEVVLTHGNGPQVGMLARQAPDTPLDVLGAESEGLVGYLLERELSPLLERPVATLLTQTIVDPDDPAFQAPTKPIGPKGARRLVASPRPLGIVELPAIRLLLEHGVVVICAGGGGIPVAVGPDLSLRGVEAVVDKDAASALLARELGADALLLLTDVDAVYADWPGRDRPIRHATVAELEGRSFEAGSMGPKVEAACTFARGGGFAAIGALEQAADVLAGTAGTRVTR